LRSGDEGDTIDKTYTTSQIAGIIGIHPNTVRLYEELELIPKPLRKANGYRVFTNVHIDHFRLARTALKIEVLQSGLRKRIIEVIKLSAKGQYDKAFVLTKTYMDIVEKEIANNSKAQGKRVSGLRFRGY
jgi:DNA-binding transcriptional MerR regulator